MRLASWDSATTAHARKAWEWANRAHLYKREPLSEVMRLAIIEFGPPKGHDAPWKAGSDEERRRWRVEFALAELLSTHPVVLRPEALLRREVTDRAERAGFPLAKPVWKGIRRKGLTPVTPPPADGMREVWAKVDELAQKIEAVHGPIARLSPLLGRLRQQPDLSEEDLQDLWEMAVTMIQREPANPVPVRLIRHFEGERNRAESYHEFSIAKRRGGVRTISAPAGSLKWLQRSLLQVLTHLFPRHACAVGFERGESVVSHARAHAGKRWVYVVDIQDFFPSITRNRVYGMLRAKPFSASEPVARYVANLATHGGALPQGAPTSPVLANLLCRRLDARLFKWARERGYQYTRYADDLAFSTNRGEFPEADQDAIAGIIAGEGFTVHPDKRKLMPWYGRQLVTGLVVNRKPNVPREYVRALRALLFNVETFGWASQVNRAQLPFGKGGYLLYKRRALSLDAFRKVVEAQRLKHKLVRPGSVISGVENVADLRRVLRGRIAFVGAVKGKDSPVYQGLLSRYRAALPAAQAVERFDRARAVAKRTYVPESAPDLSPAAKTHHYRAFKAVETEMLEGDAGREAVLGWLEERAPSSLECRWLLLQALPLDDLMDRVQKVAFELDTHPHETAQFFREFNSYRSFRGLLHAPSDQDGESVTYPDGTSLKLAEVVGNCERALEYRTLPNALLKETERVLKACTSWLQLHPTEHPWTAPDPDLRAILLGYAYLTRFQPKLLKADGVSGPYDYKAGRPLDFYARLRPFVDGLPESLRGRVHLDRRGLRFHTYVPPVRQAVELLIRSIVDKGFEATVTMERVTHARLPEIAIVVASNGGPVDSGPTYEELLGGDTQGVLHLLRGYARWTIEAPFVDATPHAFDVMSANVSPSPAAAGAELPGLRHVITLYQ